MILRLGLRPLGQAPFALPVAQPPEPLAPPLPDPRQEDNSGVALIRDFVEGDYPALAPISNAVWSNWPTTKGEIQRKDSRRDPRGVWRRWVAESDGSIVGFGGYLQHSWSFHPRRFDLELNLHPSHQGKGIGKALFGTVVDTLMPLNPLSLGAWTKEDHPRALRFLRERGFVQEMRELESLLLLGGFRPGDWAHALDRLGKEGYTLIPWRLLDKGERARHALHDLHFAICKDVPSPDPPTKSPYEQFAKRFSEPNFRPDSLFVAIAPDGTWAGMTNLWGSEGSPTHYTGLTGVLSPHRKRGLATALKAASLTAAKEAGVPDIRTWNEEGNTGMLRINGSLGFKPEPASLGCRWTIAAE